MLNQNGCSPHSEKPTFFHSDDFWKIAKSFSISKLMFFFSPNTREVLASWNLSLQNYMPRRINTYNVLKRSENLDSWKWCYSLTYRETIVMKFCTFNEQIQWSKFIRVQEMTNWFIIYLQNWTEIQWSALHKFSARFHTVISTVHDNRFDRCGIKFMIRKGEKVAVKKNSIFYISRIF